MRLQRLPESDRHRRKSMRVFTFHHTPPPLSARRCDWPLALRVANPLYFRYFRVHRVQRFYKAAPIGAALFLVGCTTTNGIDISAEDSFRYRPNVSSRLFFRRFNRRSPVGKRASSFQRSHSAGLRQALQTSLPHTQEHPSGHARALVQPQRMQNRSLRSWRGFRLALISMTIAFLVRAAQLWMSLGDFPRLGEYLYSFQP